MQDDPIKPSNESGSLPIVFPECSTSICSFSSNIHRERSFQDNVPYLVKLQNEGFFHKIEGGLMMLLKSCLDMENVNLKSVICGHVDHFQCVESEDVGWGCGWRNIQMLSSHLLTQRREVKEIIFGGLGYVPDIPSLQRWLENAWERGFDAHGAKSFNHKIYGSKKWIGATECATLLRSFGLRVRIIDFDGGTNGSSKKSTKGVQVMGSGRKKAEQAFGPMDKFLLRTVTENKSRQENISSNPSTYISLDYDISDCLNESNGPQVLADWVWNYFNSGASGRYTPHVTISNKTPLYFQHSGHSRTIIGIQRKKGVQGMPDAYNLLILDPSQSTATLERFLREKNGWQPLIKRGIHTLRKPQYQLCYVDSGIAYGAEAEHLKFLDSVLIKL